MLFSHPRIAEQLAAGFECAWQSLRPVPKVEIDFGNGRKLERTLHGNVATYFCTSQGEVFDVAPGVITPEAYLARLGQAQRLYAACGLGNAPAEAASGQLAEMFAAMGHRSEPDGRVAVARFHREAAALAQVEPEVARASLVEGAARRDFAKFMVEDRLERAFESVHLERLGETGDATAVPDSLLADTRYNREHRDPLVHALLAEEPLAKLERIGPRVYREVLGVDLEDPYLGLAPAVAGGELGRH